MEIRSQISRDVLRGVEITKPIASSQAATILPQLLFVSKGLSSAALEAMLNEVSFKIQATISDPTSGIRQIRPAREGDIQREIRRVVLTYNDF